MERTYSEKSVNENLVFLASEIIMLEEKALKKREYSDISAKDMIMLHAIGTEGAKRMSDIARKMDISMGSLTTAVNALERKGYVIREKNAEDRRVMSVSLLEKGMEALAYYLDFQTTMSEEIKAIMSEEDLQQLLEYGQKIRELIKKQIK